MRNHLSKYHLVLLVIVLCISFIKSNAKNISCHPEIDDSKKQYIIGYGSLISDQSKYATIKNVSANVPIKIFGFKRGWFHLIKNQRFLGVKKDEKQWFNAIIFSLNQPNDIHAFDTREIEYCRVKVARDKIIMLSGKKPNGEFWLYVTKRPERKIEKGKLALSYIYTFLSGCKYIEDKFQLKGYLQDCINRTFDLPKHINYDLNSSLLPKTRIVPKKENLHKINKTVCSNNSSNEWGKSSFCR